MASLKLRFTAFCQVSWIFMWLMGKYNEYKARLLNTKYNEYTTYFCNRTSFNVEYKQFTRNFSEITDNIKNLEKRYADVKEEILQFQNQYGVTFLLKTNALIYWWTVMVAWKKQITEKFLQSSRCETKICNKKLRKLVFTGTEWSLLADITNNLVKTLNSSFK